MGLEEVKREIISTAKSRAEAIIAEGKKSEEQMLRDAKERIKSLEAQHKSDLEKLENDMEIREIASAKLEAKRQLLELKKDFMDKAFDEAVNKIKALNKKENAELVDKLIKKAGKEISIGKILCNSKDTGLLKLPDGIEIGHAEIIGGIIAENKEGTVQIDLSFDTLLSDIKDKHLTEISKILFQR